MKKIVLNTLMTLLMTSSLAVANDTINAPNYVEIPKACHCVGMVDYFQTVNNFLNGCNVFMPTAEDNKTVVAERDDTLVGPRLPLMTTCLLTLQDASYFLPIAPK